MHARVECVKVAKLFSSKEESMYVLTTYIYMYAYVNIDIRKGRTKIQNSRCTRLSPFLQIKSSDDDGKRT